MYDHNTLTEEWKTLDLNALIPVAKRYLQAVLATCAPNKAYHKEYQTNNRGNSSTQPSSEKMAPKEATQDRKQRNLSAIYGHTFDPKAFEHEVGHDCCIFNGTTDHKTEECKVIKRSLAKASSTLPSSVPAKSQQPPQPSAKVANISPHNSQTLPPSVRSQIETVDLAAVHGENEGDTNSGNFNNKTRYTLFEYF